MPKFAPDTNVVPTGGLPRPAAHFLELKPAAPIVVAEDNVMAHVDGTGRICLDAEHIEPIPGWAILVHGKTDRNLVFASEDLARQKCRCDPNYHNCEIIPVMVTGKYVERL